MNAASALDGMHPVVRDWFEQTLGTPTPPQVGAWPVLMTGRDVLVAAPTGSGKTLAAFLAALNQLVIEAEAGTLTDEVRVVYVSPLKALSNDVHKNLMVPMDAISGALGKTALRAAVRTGDTPQKERNATLKNPPHVLVTTPESLYVLLGSASGRRMLGSARTVIVDEIHAVASTRRGAHLALSLERLQHICAQPLQRVGLSATQKPVEEVARFLVGAPRVDTNGTPSCVIVDNGHLRGIDVQVDVPPSPLQAVMSAEVWTEVFARLAELVRAHKTTLVFVNTRRMAERVAGQLDVLLKEALGEGLVCAHHGSMSKDKRHRAEQRLKAGELRVLVATSSLELGIDVGAVQLVCQLGVTKSIAALLQRVGRANHTTTGTPKGRLFPLTRDELAEAAALLDAVAHKDLDALVVPPGGLDILAQQIVATVADDEMPIAVLHALVKRAWPYREISDKDFTDALTLVHEGVQTHRGRRGARVFVDNVAQMVRGRKGARLAALTSGGAIADQGDYTVVEEPQGLVVGTINEDFAIESSPGDVFQLGTTSWKILKVERGTVRVQDAQGQPPSIPFWLGEAPARTRELSARLDRLRDDVSSRLDLGHSTAQIAEFLLHERGLPPSAAEQLAQYLASAHSALGTLPTSKRIVFERFHDDLGGSQIVVHAPMGGRIMRGWGLALRKRFCRSFDFELQAAATEDALLLSVGAVQGVDLTALPHFLNSKTVKTVLIQALLDAPMFGTRFRWNATRALTLLRMRGGKRVAPGLQRIEAEDLLVSLFPEQVACAENIVGDREVPDALLVRQTISDCLTEVMDIDGLIETLQAMEAGAIEVRCVESVMPSPMAHDILAAKPYAFLDDAPLEERRVQAVFVPKNGEQTIAPLSPTVVDDVLAELHQAVEHADEAHDALLLAGFLLEPELHQRYGAHMPALVDGLLQTGRVRRLVVGKRAALVAVERQHAVTTMATDSAALQLMVLSRIEVHGPRTVDAVVKEFGVAEETFLAALVQLKHTGELIDVRIEGSAQELVWAKRLTMRVRRRMLDRLRAAVAPIHAQDLMRFLLRWQRLDGEPAHGVDGVYDCLQRLAGASVPAAAWEDEVLSRRVSGYDASMLDQLCFAGRVVWARLAKAPEKASGARALRTTPIAVLPRGAAQSFVTTAEPVDIEGLTSGAQHMHAVFAKHGARFFVDVKRDLGMLPEPAEHALCELVAAGLVTSDGFAGLRALLLSFKDREKVRKRTRGRTSLVPGASVDAGGRWSLVASAANATGSQASVDTGDVAEQQAHVLLNRFGVVFRRLVERETGLMPWREVLMALRRLELRGDVRGGRFVHGFSGEQFALPHVIAMLRDTKNNPHDHKSIVISAADPMNLTGVILPGARVAAVLGHRLLLQDGLPVAVLDAQGVRLLDDTALDLGTIDALLRKGPRARFARPSAKLTTLRPAVV